MFRAFLKILILTVLSVSVFPDARAKSENGKNFTVIIDAGHGGKDIGATDNGVREKDINLKVAKNLENIIKKKLKNTKVVMTRDNDSYLTLQQRADIANKNQGDIFISIHTNSVDKKNRNRKNIAGSSVYTLGLHKDDNNLAVAMRENSVIELEDNYQQFYSGFDPQRDESYIIFEMAQKKNLSQSIRFAENIEKELVKSGRQDRGVHQAGFWVLWATSMPSVLVELDFICNPESAKYISSDKGAKELAEAIFKAVENYESSWRKSFEGVGNDLSDTYIEDSESILEDTYVSVASSEVTRAKSRVHKEKAPVTLNSNKRKRRSLASRQKSENQDFEASNLIFPNISGQEIAIVPVEEEETVPAMASVDEKSKKGKKEKKKKEDKKDKKEAKKQQPKKRENAYNAKVNKLVTVYKIQILASTELLGQENSRFCGLKPITAYKENNLYKYYYGESTDRQEMERLLTDVRTKIPDAFIVSGRKSIQTK